MRQAPIGWLTTVFWLLMLNSCSSPTDPLMIPADAGDLGPRVEDSARLDGPSSDVPGADVVSDAPPMDTLLTETHDSANEIDVFQLPDLPSLELPFDAGDALDSSEVDSHGAPEVWDVAPELTDAYELEVLPEVEFEVEDAAAEVAPDLEEELLDEIVEEIDVEPGCDPYEPPLDPPVGSVLAAADFVKIGKAVPDEVYVNGAGIEMPKTNEAYVWSIAREGNRTWIGTVANTLCLGFTGFGGISLAYETVNAVCANSNSEELFPDWRMPALWMFDDDTNTWQLRTEPEGTEENPGIAAGTQGWRAAIGVDDYALVAGPGMGILWGMPDYGTALLIYKAGQYIGAHRFTEHNDARKFLEVNGQVYLGSFRWDGKGIILRWNRDESAPPESLFEFTEVGVIDGSAAWLEYYKGRIYAITWPTSLSGGGKGFEVWRSPLVPPCGLDVTHGDQWEKVFSYSDYDVNPDTAKLASGGSMITFRGSLYFGSMHVPFAYSCTDPGNLITCAFEKYLNTHPISFFRLTESDESGELNVECLFGQDKGGIYQPVIGPAGFGNHYNNYTWSLAVHDGWLYLGTMDYSFFLEDALGSYGLPGSFPGMVPKQQDGFDVFASSDGNNWAPVITNGLGNKFNWGARHLVSDGEYLWLGTANPFNLNPNGGWELWRAQ